MSRDKFLTRDDRLVAAMELLRRQGVGGVRILPLAKEVGVSRGSFYWQFDDREDLLAIYLMSEGTIHAGESETSRLRLLRRQVHALLDRPARGGARKRKRPG